MITEKLTELIDKFVMQAGGYTDNITIECSPVVMRKLFAEELEKAPLLRLLDTTIADDETEEVGRFMGIPIKVNRDIIDEDNFYIHKTDNTRFFRVPEGAPLTAEQEELLHTAANYVREYNPMNNETLFRFTAPDDLTVTTQIEYGGVITEEPDTNRQAFDREMFDALTYTARYFNTDATNATATNFGTYFPDGVATITAPTTITGVWGTDTTNVRLEGEFGPEFRVRNDEPIVWRRWNTDWGLDEPYEQARVTIREKLEEEIPEIPEKDYMDIINF